MGGEEMQQQIVIKDVSHTNSEIVCSKNQIESFVKRQQTIMDKLKILTDAAKYVVSLLALVI